MTPDEYRNLVMETNEIFRELLANLSALKIVSSSNFSDINLYEVQHCHYNFINTIVKPLEK